jgi:hypothetical protein
MTRILPFVFVLLCAGQMACPLVTYGQTTPAPPTNGKIAAQTGKDSEVFISIDGDDFTPSSLFIAIDALTANGFWPIVEDVSIRRLIGNTKTSPYMDGIKAECVAGYSRWLQEGSIPPNAECCVSYAIDGPWNFRRNLSTSRATRIASRRDFKTVPHLKITSQRASVSYRSSRPGDLMPSLGGTLTLWASKRTVDFRSDDKALWSYRLPEPTFPISWGTDNPLRTKPEDETNQQYKDFLRRIFPSTVLPATAARLEPTATVPTTEPRPTAASPAGLLGNIVIRQFAPVGGFWMYGVAFAPDGRSLVTRRGTDEKYAVYLAATGARDGSFDDREPYGHGRVSFSADGKLCAVRSKVRKGDDNIKVYKLPEFSLVRTIRDVDVSYGDFWWLSDGKTLLVQKADRVTLWMAETGENVATFNVSDPIVAVSQDGRYVAAARTAPLGGDAHSLGYRVEIIPTANPARRKSFVAHKAWIGDVAFSPEGSMLASASADKMIKLWSVPEGKLIRTLEGHDGIVKAVRYLPDGKTLISGGLDETIRIWDVASGSETGRVTIPGWAITCLDLAPDGLTVAVGDQSGRVALLNYQKLKAYAEAELAAGQPNR